MRVEIPFALASGAALWCVGRVGLDDGLVLLVAPSGSPARLGVEKVVGTTFLVGGLEHERGLSQVLRIQALALRTTSRVDGTSHTHDATVPAIEIAILIIVVVIANTIALVK